MSAYAIQTKKLSKKFGKDYAVKNVSIAVKPGEIYGFLGPNGAGKSTTVKMLVTLLSPSEGSAEVLGAKVSTNSDEVRLQIGVALQEAALDGMQTGRELLELQGRLYGLTKKEVKARLEELSELVDIGDALDDRIKTYSGGMKRRVDLAAALIHKPNVLFLDEPTTGLDPVSRTRIWEEVRKINQEQNVTIFLTTQYLEEADALADRVGIISNGKIVAEDTPKKLKSKIGNDVIELSFTGTAEPNIKAIKKLSGVKNCELNKNLLSISCKNGPKVLPEIIKMFDTAGIDIDELSVRQPTLDDVFLEVTGNTKGGK